ncbi:uncharacterized protein LOC123514041 [Portunus trituberculatus]|uniref:uncharacterized protein LOC123514041 n=1 Tax=Portunus trituberculatus TaxID=210409 RepID=UPI001E1D1329|nr:uncharacterized protein LOC123514041 [Portunus trituberculatus]
MTSRSKEGLRQVREDELNALEDRLIRHLPHSFIVYSSVCLAARYGLHCLRPVTILIPADTRRSCFTVIRTLTSSGSHDIMVFWSLEEHTAEDVADYLSHTIDLNLGQHEFSISLPDILLPSLQSLKNIGSRPVRIQHKLHGHLYTFQEPSILNTRQLKLLPEYQVSNLKEEDVSVIWKNWQFSSLSSENSLRDDIINFPSVGIRKRNLIDSSTEELQEETQETLVSWIRTSKYGFMGSTFTLPQYRRRGLAGTATLILTRQLMQEGLLPAVMIEKNNTASISFHGDLGFVRQCALSMVALLPV